MKLSSIEKLPPIVALGGVTASGKSSLALELAKKYNGIIVNADSKQVYTELNIGTAKPVPQVVEESKWLVDGVEHYLYGYISIYENYNLYRYQQDCFNLFHELGPNRPVFLVGGSGLYINAIIYNYNLAESENGNIREELESLSLLQMQEMIGDSLRDLNESDRENKRRLVRVLEGRTEIQPGDQLRHIYLYLDKPKEEVSERIEVRTKQMFENGLVEEASTFKKEILSGHPHFEVIGYKEFKSYFDGEIDLEEVKELVTIHTRQYAKRQRTWFRNKTDAIEIEGIEDATSYIENFLNS